MRPSTRSLVSLAALMAIFPLYGFAAESRHGLLKRRLDARTDSATVLSTSRTTAPDGAVIVAQDGSGDFSSIAAAVDSGATSIFVQPGTYNEQVSVTVDGVSIYGSTRDTSSYAANEVILTYGLSATEAGNNDESGTLRVHADDFKLYNIDVKNSYGKGSQALALSAYGERQGFYGCGFYGYQDTILTNEGTQYFSKSYIEGATDFIFGQKANSYFDHCTIGIVGAGYITASGRDSADKEGMYVFNSCSVEQASSVTDDLTGKAYLGRPWRNYARAVFKYCSLSDVISPAGWRVWNEDDPRTDHLLFAEYSNSGASAWSSSRASFATQLTEDTKGAYAIGNVLGSDYASWIDSAFAPA